VDQNNHFNIIHGLLSGIYEISIEGDENCNINNQDGHLNEEPSIQKLKESKTARRAWQFLILL